MKPALVLAGAAALAAAWVIALAGNSSFAGHMAAHMTVVAIAAPLLALGISNTRFDPVTMAPLLFAAIPASMIELFTVWVWHAPVLHQAARHRLDMFVFEQTSFLGAGLYLWLSLVGGGEPRRLASRGSGIIALVLTFAHMTLLGALLSLTPRPLYHGAAGDLAALTDQQLGGAIMLVVSALVYIGGGVWLGASLLKDPRTLVRPV